MVNARQNVLVPVMLVLLVVLLVLVLLLQLPEQTRQHKTHLISGPTESKPFELSTRHCNLRTAHTCRGGQTGGGDEGRRRQRRRRRNTSEARRLTHCASAARFSSTASPRKRLPDAASFVSCAKPDPIAGSAASPLL